MEVWDIFLEKNKHYLKFGGEKWGRIDDIKTDTLGMLKVTRADGEHKLVNLKHFDVKNSAYKDIFRPTLFSRTEFRNAWSAIKVKTKGTNNTASTSAGKVEENNRNVSKSGDCNTNEKGDTRKQYPIKTKVSDSTDSDNSETDTSTSFASKVLVKTKGTNNTASTSAGKVEENNRNVSKSGDCNRNGKGDTRKKYPIKTKGSDSTDSDDIYNSEMDTSTSFASKALVKTKGTKNTASTSAGKVEEKDRKVNGSGVCNKNGKGDTRKKYQIKTKGSDSTDSDNIYSSETDTSTSFASKVLGESLEIHIANMVSPQHKRIFRELDNTHVEEIKEALRLRKNCFTILVGNVKNYDTTKHINKEHLKRPYKYKVETLGGNHTRQAIQELLEEDHGAFKCLSVIRCKLYANLSDVDALKIGFEHNISNELSKQTTAEDLLKVCRRELVKICNEKKVCVENIPNHVSKEWHKQLNHIFGFKGRDLHNKFKVVLSLSKSSKDVWEQLENLFQLFSSKEIKYQPQGWLKQSHLKPLISFNEEEKFEILTKLIKKLDWRCIKGRQGRRPAHKPKKRKNESESSDAESVSREYKTLKAENNVFKERIKTLEAQLVATKSDVKRLTSRNTTLLKTIADKDSDIKILEKKCEDQEEDLAYFMYRIDDKEQDKDSEMPTTNTPEPSDNVHESVIESSTRNVVESKSSCENAMAKCDIDSKKITEKGSTTIPEAPKGNRDYQCDLCDKYFDTEQTLQEHIDLHHLSCLKKTAHKPAKKQFWEYIENASDIQPKKAFKAAEGPRRKKIKL